jgi:hypothetical protein
LIPSVYCEYGYFDDVVYASSTQRTRPLITTGYGSLS